MAENPSAAEDLTRDTEKILATRPGLDALRTASCPSIARCVEVFTDPRAGWTDRERQHFRSCPYCFEVGTAMARASSRLAPRVEERAPPPERLAAAIRRILRLKGSSR